MTDLYLIAHRVRGEPAFDVAIQMGCPECDSGMAGEDHRFFDCTECDSLGYWWIIPTSGHRAYPWHWAKIECEGILSMMPPSLPDHYPTRAEPKLDLAQMLGIGKAKPQPTNFKRRI